MVVGERQLWLRRVAGRRDGWQRGGQSEVGQDAVDDSGVVDELDAVHRSLTARADEHAPVEDAGQQLSPRAPVADRRLLGLFGRRDARALAGLVMRMRAALAVGVSIWAATDVGLAVASAGSWRGWRWWRHERPQRRAELGVCGEDAVKADQMLARFGDRGGEAADKSEGLEDDG